MLVTATEKKLQHMLPYCTMFLCETVISILIQKNLKNKAIGEVCKSLFLQKIILAFIFKLEIQTTCQYLQNKKSSLILNIL